MQLNSFQAIIATDKRTSFVIFIYSSIEWTSPDGTGAKHGVGADPSKLPILGISDGYQYEQLVLGSSGEPHDEEAILTVDTDDGNTGVPGMWVFEASETAATQKGIRTTVIVYESTASACLLRLALSHWFTSCM